MAWYFEEKAGRIHLTITKKEEGSFQVSKVRSSADIGKISVFLVGGKKEVLVLKNFNPTNAVSGNFRECLHSRTLFIEKFDEVAKRLGGMVMQDNTGDTLSVSSDLSGTSQDNKTLRTTATVPSPSGTSQDTETLRTTATVPSPSGKCVAVHIDNLFPPAEERQVRPINYQHVKDLELSLEKQSQQYKMLLGLLTSGSVEDIAMPGSCRVEVLGGNHTRAALQSMKAKGGDAPETVQCILYVDLSDKDCLRLGLTHNTIDSCSMQMSFMDEVRLIRQVTFTNPQDNARRILRDVFSLKSTNQFRTNYRTHEVVAKSSDMVWSKVQQVADKWQEKRPLRQTFFKRWSAIRDDDSRVSLLETYLVKGLAEYKKEVDAAYKAVVGDRENREDEVMTKRARSADSESSSNSEESENEGCWKRKYEELLEKHIALQEENERLQKVAKQVEQKRRFRQDDKVLAYWKEQDGQEKWLKAKVLQVLSSGTYKIKYVCDGFMCKVKEKDLKEE